MPADSSPAASSSKHSFHYLVGLLAGVFSFVALSLVFSRIGVGKVETLIFAFLSAVTVGIFVYRERSLVAELALTEHQHSEQLRLETERLDELYSNSVACLVMFDAGSLVIDRVSFGFLDLLGVSVDRDLVGARLEEVLSVDSTHLASVVYQIKVGTISVREEIECKRSDGKVVKLRISGHYLPHRHLVEAAFHLLPRKETEIEDYERVIGDLERFKKGIVRREGRVLELKGEVNELLGQLKKPDRYQVDAATDDSRFVQRTLKSKKARGRG